MGYKFDCKLYFSLCTFIDSIIGQIVPVVYIYTTAHPRQNNPSTVAFRGCFSLPVDGILFSLLLSIRGSKGQTVVVSVWSVNFGFWILDYKDTI